jgi:uncharacterized protein (DUF2141 family)
MVTRRRLARGVVAFVAAQVAARADAQPPAAPPPAAGRLVLVFTGLRSDRGTVHASLYADRRRWPQDHGDIARCSARISARRAVCEIAGVVRGVYAIAITHDENNNGRFDQGFLGWPLEGYGFSNNVRPEFLSPPSFDRARFTYAGGPPLTVTMTMQY